MEQNLRTREDVLKVAAKKAGISLEQMNRIEIDLHNMLRKYLSDPLSTKKGILINEFMKFELKTGSIKKRIDKGIITEPETLEFYNKLLKQVSK